MKASNIYQEANNKINQLLNIKQTNKRNTMKTSILTSFSTKGKKYQIVLIKDNYGYCIKNYKNGDCNGTNHLGNCSLAKALLEIDSEVRNAKYFDSINYIQD